MTRLRSLLSFLLILSILLVTLTNYASLNYYINYDTNYENNYEINHETPPLHNELHNELHNSALNPNPILPTTSPTTVTYTITLTSCSSTSSHDSTPIGLIDGAYVLKKSILMHSPPSHSPAFVAYVHEDAEGTECHRSIEDAGWECRVVPTPLDVSKIKTPNLRSHISLNGCCGAHELIKLYAYLLPSPVSVILDVDSLILRPLDSAISRIINMGEGAGMYTEDWGMVQPGRKAGAQGGFLILRPSLSTFTSLINIVLNVPFNEPGKPGWNGTGVGPFWGAMTFQGLIPFYYREVNEVESEVLNRCEYNNMRDNPYTKDETECRGPVKGVKICQDCRETKVEDIYSAHFTLCQKPWGCHLNSKTHCKVLHDEWFYVRERLEVEVLGGEFEGKGMKGYCKKGGKDGYVRIGDDVMKAMHVKI